MNKQRVFVVLGMHRSGTSVIARGLQVLGVALGNNLMPPIADNNEKGFWEDIDISTFDNEILHALGSDWHYLAPIQPGDIEVLRKKSYFPRAIELLRRKIGDAPVFGFKDPRVTKLFPFWKEVFDQCELDVSYVLTIRHPLSVAKSLARRDGFDTEKSYLLWLGHVIVSLSGTVGEKCILVDYDHLMQSPDFELNRIAQKLDLEIDPAGLQNYKAAFLDEELRHTVYDLNDLLSDDACPPLVREIYSELLEVASDKKKIDELSLQKKVDIWAGEFERFKLFLLLADKLSTQIAAARQTVIRQDSRIANLNLQIAQIHSSTSWKITLPFREVRRWINNPFSQVKKYSKSLLKLVKLCILVRP
ncbi:MAG: hypothetical protein A2031_01735 [Deltaproteobacteria bacterium RBG_19FT_COMBO_43_11]|nr:MAG: hypothetical protein A2031_01735 [Deltaproteobacteria bacterium RBG_19FT_COMBO_43_11]